MQQSMWCLSPKEYKKYLKTRPAKDKMKQAEEEYKKNGYYTYCGLKIKVVKEESK